MLDGVTTAGEEVADTAVLPVRHANAPGSYPQIHPSLFQHLGVRIAALGFFVTALFRMADQAVYLGDVGHGL